MNPASADKLLATLIREPPKFDLACVGTSICGLKALTIESISYLVHADLVYYYPVTSRHLEFLEQLNTNVIDLNSSLYQDGRSFNTAYSDIIDDVLSTVRSGKKTVYAVQGSPAFLAYTSIELVRRVTIEGRRAVMVPGVSSFECLLAALALHHDLYDIQLYNCASVVTSSSKIDPRTPCLLFNLSVHASPVISKATNQFEPEQVEVLRQALSTLYPQSHALKLLVVHPDGQCIAQDSTIATMNADIRSGPPTITIFVPAIR